MSSLNIAHFLIAATSNFHEFSHGKEIPDGVGATVNRLADAAVLHGKDTENASSLLEDVSTVIALHLVPAEEVSSATEKLLKCKLVYPVHYKVLSCNCSKPSMCMCYSKCVAHLENAIDVSLWVKGDMVEIDNQQLGEPVDDRQSY